MSREELFALVWEKPTREVAKEFGVSDVAISKLCARLQVPKPPRGYWARVQSGKTPRQPSLPAFREEIDRQRREAARVKAAGLLSNLEKQLYAAALSDLRRQAIDGEGADLHGSRLPDLEPDIAAQIMFLIQNRVEDWVQRGRIVPERGRSVQGSAASLVERLLPLARAQLLLFENEHRRSWDASGPVVLLRLTAHLQERIAALVRIVRDQKLKHVVMPLMAVDHAWTVRHIHAPEMRLFLDSTLCVSTNEIWVEWLQKAWREEDAPERKATGRLRLQEIMPIDYMPRREVAVSPTISRATVAPYRERLRGLLEAERVHEMLLNAAFAMEREVPDETLALTERIWFGSERPFRSARQAWHRVEHDLEQWATEIEADRSALARSILGVEIGDIVTAQQGERLVRLSVTGVSLHAGDNHITFGVSGKRFRKDGTLGKLDDTLWLHFENEA